MNNLTIHPGNLYRVPSKPVICLSQFCLLDSHIREKIIELISANSTIVPPYRVQQGDLYFENVRLHQKNDRWLSELVARELLVANVNPTVENPRGSEVVFEEGVYDSPIEIEDVYNKAALCVQQLEKQKEKIFDALTRYETFGTARDEFERSEELLRNISLNREYFVRKAHGVTSYLPKNQPLYALVCFGVVPSLMSEATWVRPPQSAQPTFRHLWPLLNFDSICPNLHLSFGTREEFTRQQSPRTDVVIFVGKAENGFRVRKAFSPNTLFIFNGAGHNPILITPSADIQRATKSVLRVALMNQGQDCSQPNAVFIHSSIVEQFKHVLFRDLENISSLVGPYENKFNLLGPNSEIEHSLKIAHYFNARKSACVWGGRIDPITNTIWPTVFQEDAASADFNYMELFAPVISLYTYDDESELKRYFEDERYLQYSMYLTVWGESEYARSLEERGLHERGSVLHNTDLHKEEKGYLPYVGCGPKASCILIGDRRVNGATLPQREIYKYLVEPSLQSSGNRRSVS